MPKCDGCGDKRCACVIVDGDNTEALGVGSKSDPYRINVDLSGISGANRLTGEIVMYGAGVAPAGWLICDGSAVSRTTYSALFTRLGTVYGAGDGSTTFNLPDLAGRFAFGADSGHDRGTIGGQETTTLVTNNVPAHTHTIAHTHQMGHNHAIGHNHDMSHNHGGATGDASNTNHRHDVNFARQSDAATTGSGNRVTGVGSGSESGQTANQSLPHTHPIPAHSGPTGFDNRGGYSDNDSRGGITGGSSAANSGSTGSGLPFTNMPPYTALTFLIKT